MKYWRYTAQHMNIFWGKNKCLPFPSGLLYITYVTIQNTESNLSDTQRVSTGLQPK